MNTSTETLELRILLKRMAGLLVIAAITVCLQGLFDETFFFSFASLGRPNSYLHWLAALPVLLAVTVLLQNLFNRFVAGRIAAATVRNKSRQIFTVALYGTICFFSSPNPLSMVALVAGAVLLFCVESLTSSATQGRVSKLVYGLLALLLLYVPVSLVELQTELSRAEFYLILIFKTCFMMRVVSWIVDRRIYDRTDHSSLFDFLEFLLCPVFFVMPGQIQYFTYRYFHQSKSDLHSNQGFLTAGALGLWGLVLIVLFGQADALFSRHFEYFLEERETWRLLFVYFLAGLYWLVAVYWLQAGGMSYQVSVARYLGYQFKYDMHLPLAARSPLDYLRRHSSYVRDYIVEVGVRPVGLHLLRRGWKTETATLTASIVSYAILIMPQTGYRADYHRPWLSTLVLVGFSVLFILLPYLSFGLSFTKKNSSSLSSPIEFKPLSLWKLADYARWGGTIGLLAISKGLFVFCRTL